MLCKNCRKEIGTQKECSFCGYSPEIDGSDNAAKNTKLVVKLPETKIELLKKKNKMATSGLVMSILSFCPFPFMLLAFIFNIKGTLRCKPYRNGLVKCIFAWIFFLFWTLLYGTYAYAIIQIIMQEAAYYTGA